MFLVICGTNRPGSNSLKVCKLVAELLQSEGQQTRILDLAELPAEVFRPEAYAEKPASFAPFQEAIDTCTGAVVVVAEYNGGPPGVLKYFIDMLRFPGSLDGLPSAFVGVAAGTFGGLRAVEQIQMVFQYRNALLFPLRVFMTHVHKSLDEEGKLGEGLVLDLLRDELKGFVPFALTNARNQESAG